MKLKTGRFTYLILLCCGLVSACLTGCSSLYEAAGSKTRVGNSGEIKLRYINEFVLPHHLEFQHTTVGGLSGIDYDSQNNIYYLICDDRSHINPARFYKAHILISSKGIDSVIITGVNTLLQQDGTSYPELNINATRTTDPEAMRLNRRTHHLIWTSEGERLLLPKDTVLIDPTINVIDTTGRYVNSISLPQNLKMEIAEHGPRRNGVLEGLTFDDHYRSLYVSMEEPLYQDGPRADLSINHPLIRIYKFNLKTGKHTAQYAYELEPVALPALTDGGEISNGIPDILWLGKDKLMVTERSYSTGRLGTNIKVFLADMKGADNVMGVESLLKTPPAHVLSKKLLVNMDNLGIYIDNIEGATLGPVLPNGHQSVIFVADNNFSTTEKNQFLLFEVLP